MPAIDDLIAEVERSYKETQERMADPSVYNDHREAADVGRRLKELEGPHKLAQEWSEIREDLEAAQGDGDLKELIPELEERLAQVEEDLKLALVETDPADRKDVLVEIRQGVGGDEAALWAKSSRRARATAAVSRRSRSQSRATGPIRSSSGKAVRTVCSACRRRSHRVVSTRPQRPWP
jgi:peptide chain release factor 1